MIDDGGWVIVAAATVLAFSIVEKMWRTAPGFVALQMRLHGRDDRITAFLRQLNDDADQAVLVDRVRRLDLRLPVVAGIALVGWNLLLAEFLRTDATIAKPLLIIGVASCVVAAIADYVENYLLGHMVDALPELPVGARILNTTRVTKLKCWAYIAALVIVLAHIPVYLFR